MNPNVRADEIVAIFQRYLSTDDDSEVRKLTLREIQSADEQLGQRDERAGFRIAMRNRISDLQLIDQRQHERKLRVWSLVKGVVIGLVVAGLSYLLFGR